MSLAKAIEYGKERRRPYRGSARFDRSCRHSGTCPYCARNRMINQRRTDMSALLRGGEDG